MEHLFYIIVSDFKMVFLSDFSFLSNTLYSKRFSHSQYWNFITYITNLFLYLWIMQNLIWNY